MIIIIFLNKTIRKTASKTFKSGLSPMMSQTQPKTIQRSNDRMWADGVGLKLSSLMEKLPTRRSGQKKNRSWSGQ